MMVKSMKEVMNVLKWSQHYQVGELPLLTFLPKEYHQLCSKSGRFLNTKSINSTTDEFLVLYKEKRLICVFIYFSFHFIFITFCCKVFLSIFTCNFCILKLSHLKVIKSFWKILYYKKIKKLQKTHFIPK